MNPSKTIYVTAFFTLANLATIYSSQVMATSKETDALMHATVSLPQAIELLEKDGKGKTVGAEFDIEKDTPIWEVKMLGSDGVIEYKVNAQNASIFKIEDEHIQGKLMGYITGITLPDLLNEKTPLDGAIAMAEKKFSGKVAKVQIEHEKNSIQYDMFICSDKGKHRLKMDAMSGKILKSK